MADLLTHVLLAFIVAKVLSLRYHWITTPYITSAMLGGVLPDLDRIELLIPAVEIEQLLGIPFSWDALHRGGPVLVFVLICGYLVPERHRLRVICMVGLGAGLHLFTDLFSGDGWGASYAVFWPLTTWAPTMPGWYLSSDIRIAPTFLLLAAITWLAVEEAKYRGWAADPPARSVQD